MTSIKITGGKGFHLTFDCGVTLSVQIGVGNYCDNYSSLNTHKDLGSSTNAEIALWIEDEILPHHWLFRGDIRAYVPAARIFQIIALLTVIPADASMEQIRGAVSAIETLIDGRAA